MSTTASNEPAAPNLRLVVEYNDSDGCTYSCTMTKAVVYASAEAFAVDFEAWCHTHKGEFRLNLKFAGVAFSPSSFFEEDVYYGPTIMTVDEWFVAAEKL